jgi:hypothetical protein
MTSMTIGRLAKTAGVPVDTIRYYEKVGLLAPPRRSATGYRHYGAETVERLGFIAQAKTPSTRHPRPEGSLAFGSATDSSEFDSQMRDFMDKLQTSRMILVVMPWEPMRPALTSMGTLTA